MKLIATTLAAITLASAVVAIAQPQLRTPPPVSATVQPGVPWQKSKNAEADAPTTEFTASEPRVMTCELGADGYEQTPPSAPGVLTTPRDCVSDEERPPQVGVVWGQQGLPRFDGVVEGVATKYTMFPERGAPVRATTDADAATKTKGGATVRPVAPARQSAWTPRDFRTTPETPAPQSESDEDDDDDPD